MKVAFLYILHMVKIKVGILTYHENDEERV